MGFLVENWFYILVVVLFVAIHVVEGGCGRKHHGCHQHRRATPDQPGIPESQPPSLGTAVPQTFVHGFRLAKGEHSCES